MSTTLTTWVWNPPALRWLRQASILQDLPIELGEGQTSPHGSHVLPASCAPVLECVHSGHDLLEARLFLTWRVRGNPRVRSWSMESRDFPRSDFLASKDDEWSDDSYSLEGWWVRCAWHAWKRQKDRRLTFNFIPGHRSPWFSTTETRGPKQSQGVPGVKGFGERVVICCCRFYRVKQQYSTLEVQFDYILTDWKKNGHVLRMVMSEIVRPFFL